MESNEQSVTFSASALPYEEDEIKMIKALDEISITDSLNDVNTEGGKAQPRNMCNTNFTALKNPSEPALTCLDRITQSNIIEDIEEENGEEKSTEPKYNERRTSRNNKNLYSKDHLSSNNNDNLIIFVFKKEQMRYDIHTVVKACPVLGKYVNQIAQTKSSILVHMPDWICQSDLLEYFFYFKNSSSHEYDIQVRKILQIADFFENGMMMKILINKELIPYISTENALALLEDSFQRLTEMGDNKIWFDLFVAAMECVSRNLIYFLSHDYNKMKHMNKKLLEEIVEKFLEYYLQTWFPLCSTVGIQSSTNHTNNTTCGGTGDSADTLQPVIDFIHILRNNTSNSIFDLLINEYMRISSQESVNELLHTSIPIFRLSLHKDIINFYQEYCVNFSSFLDVIFIVFYKRSDDSLNVNFKIKFKEINGNQCNYRLPVLTFLSIALFQEDPDKKQICVKSLSHSKSSISIFRINQFKQNFIKTIPLTEGKNLSMAISLKLNFLHSAVTNFLLFHYDQFYNDKNINKVSKNLLKLILSSLKLRYIPTAISEDFLVCSFVNWLNDEINLNDENLKEVIEIIDWKKVSCDVLLEFVIKFYKIIEIADMEGFFCELIDKAVLQEKENGAMGKNLLKSARNVNYCELFMENLKFSKMQNLIKEENKSDNSNSTPHQKSVEDHKNERNNNKVMNLNNESLSNKSKIISFLMDEEENENENENENLNMMNNSYHTSNPKEAISQHQKNELNYQDSMIPNNNEHNNNISSKHSNNTNIQNEKNSFPEILDTLVSHKTRFDHSKIQIISPSDSLKSNHPKMLHTAHENKSTQKNQQESTRSPSSNMEQQNINVNSTATLRSNEEKEGIDITNENVNLDTNVNVATHSNTCLNQLNSLNPITVSSSYQQYRKFNKNISKNYARNKPEAKKILSFQEMDVEKKTGVASKKNSKTKSYTEIPSHSQHIGVNKDTKKFNFYKKTSPERGFNIGNTISKNATATFRQQTSLNKFKNLKPSIMSRRIIPGKNANENSTQVSLSKHTSSRDTTSNQIRVNNTSVVKHNNFGNKSGDFSMIKLKQTLKSQLIALNTPQSIEKEAKMKSNCNGGRPNKKSFGSINTTVTTSSKHNAMQSKKKI